MRMFYLSDVDIYALNENGFNKKICSALSFINNKLKEICLYQ